MCSDALQGNALWENVIGMTNEQAGTNTQVEALIHAPQRGKSREAKAAGRKAAAEAVIASGGFDSTVTSYQGLLSLAKLQGAVGGNASRGACKICGQLGHLTKQCRNQFSKYYEVEKEPEQKSVAEELSESSDFSSIYSTDSGKDRKKKHKRVKEKKAKKKKKKRKCSSD